MLPLLAAICAPVGERTPDYKNTFVFENDYAALKPDLPEATLNRGGGLIHATTERGICRVLCFNPRHDRTWPPWMLPPFAASSTSGPALERELAGHPNIRYVQIFENRGPMMGASYPGHAKLLHQ